MHNQTQEQEIRCVLAIFIQWNRNSPLLVFSVKCVLKIYRKLTGEHPYQSEISKNFLCNFAEITLRHGCFPVNLLHILRTPFPKNTYGGVFLEELFSKKRNIGQVHFKKLLEFPNFNGIFHCCMTRLRNKK